MTHFTHQGVKPDTTVVASNGFLTVAQRNDRTFGGNLVGDAGPTVLLLALFVITVIFGQLINTQIRPLPRLT